MKPAGKKDLVCDEREPGRRACGTMTVAGTTAVAMMSEPAIGLYVRIGNPRKTLVGNG